MSHTEGNWRVVLGEKDGDIHIETEEHQICGIYPNVSASGLLRKKTHLANAYLIAAAPDLLAACKGALTELVSGTKFAAEQILKYAITEAEKED